MSTVEIKVESLSTLQKMSHSQLIAISKARGNRQYSLAAGFMASAMEAHALGNTTLMIKYVERAKMAHKRAQKEERAQVRRQLGVAV